MIGPVPGDPQARLFSVLYYGDDTGVIDPLAEVREFCNKVKGLVGDKKKALTDKRNSSRGAVLVFAVLAAASLLAMIVMRSGVMLVPLVVFGSLALWKKLALSGIDAELVKYGVGPAPAPVLAPAVQPVSTVGPEVPQVAAETPQPEVSGKPGQAVHRENWFTANWKLIAGVAVGLVLLLVVVRVVVMNQNEKAAEKARQDKSNYEFEHRDFDPSKLLPKDK
jgi:nitrate/nitrite transporter NarK